MRCCLEFPQKSVDGSYKNILIILLKDKRIIKFSINTSSVSRCEPPSPSGEGEEVASLPVSGRLSICLPFKSSSPLNKNLPPENFLNYFQKSIDKRILLWYSITRTDRTRSALILFEIRRSTQVGRRGAPAKGVGRIFNRRESSNLSFSAKKKSRVSGFFFLYFSLFSFHSSLFSNSPARLFQRRDKREERKEKVAFLPLVEKH